MESLAAFHVEDWDLMNRISSNEDDQLEFMQQILHQFSFPLEHDVRSSFMSPSSFCPNPEANTSIAGVVDEDLFYSFNALDSNIVHYKSEESSQSSDSSSGVLVHLPNYDTYLPSDPDHIGLTNDATMSFDISMDIDGVSDKMIDSFPPAAFPNFGTDHPAASAVHANELLLTRKFDVLELHDERDQINTISSQSPKKRPRVSKDEEKVKTNSQSKKARKNNLNGNEESNIVSDGQSSSTCSSDDNTNGVSLAASESKASPALNLNGKKRASRGSATDPQSLYARRRRERINERLRILQELVPNGTKVDISTMLEEAVQYVKFLQLQIKLLSSDELWMYAPLAYNGVDIGLNNNICTLL